MAVLVRLAYRELRDRRVRLSRLFIAPALLALVAAALVVVAAGDAGPAWPALAGATIGALAIGIGAGLGSARYTTLRLTEEPGVVFTRGSYATLAIWGGALALRSLARFAGGHAPATTTIANAAVVTLLAAATAVVRYRILVEARAARRRGTTEEIAAI